MITGRLAVALGLLTVLGPLAWAAPSGAAQRRYTLEFTPTQNASSARGTMTLTLVESGAASAAPTAVVDFVVTGAAPNTVYTIWIVFNKLIEPLPTTGTKVPSVPARDAFPEFPAEGNGVSPLAPLNAGFTSGMGMDPGASFVTDARGDGRIRVALDYDLVDRAPVSNRDLIAQCVPGPLASDGRCPLPSRSLRVTTTWLRRFIGEYPLSQRASACANYDAAHDPDDVSYDRVASYGTDARLWQCVDPGTVDPRTGNGVPRVHWFTFDHFRLANHPDDLTHGFIGGNETDHYIDMVGRRADLVPVR